MLDTVIYNEIRKIDSREVSSTPQPGSLVDIIKKSGDKPYTNFTRFETTSTTYVEALNITGKGKALILARVISTAWASVKITIDGTAIIEYDAFFGGNITSAMNLGEYSFNNSLKVEILTSNSTYAARAYISYYLE